MKGRRVLVTGHTGFKGSWLALWLAELGAEVHGFSLPDLEGPSHFELGGVKDRVADHRGDVRDPASLRRAFAAARPEVVFHLAAQALVRESYADPKGTFDVNVGGTVNVLEEVRACREVRAAVVVTSDKCYENRETTRPYVETDAMGGHDPYSASKGAAELVAASYRRSFFAPEGRVALATARAGNVFGGGDFAATRLVPDVVRAIASGKPVVLRNPTSVRPWQHVLEPVSGYLALAEALLASPAAHATAYNFGPAADDHVTVLELARRFVAAYGEGAIEVGAERGPHEAGLLVLSCEKAQRALGWEPRLDVREAIGWAAAWYRAWAKGPASELPALSRAQLAAYRAR